MRSIFVLYIHLHIRWVASDNSEYYVRIVGWIYRTKIDPISILHPSSLSLFTYFFEQWSSLNIFFHFHSYLHYIKKGDEQVKEKNFYSKEK